MKRLLLLLLLAPFLAFADSTRDTALYTFDASAQTVTVTAIKDLRHVTRIVNTTVDVVIYQPDNPDAGGSEAVDVVTLDYDTTSMADADVLLVEFESVGTSFQLEQARQHIDGQRSFFFFGFSPAVTTAWVDIQPTVASVQWQTSAVQVSVSSSNVADDAGQAGLLSVELHGLSDTGVDQSEVLALDGTTEVHSVLTYRRLNKMHSETVGTYGGSHEGDITARVFSSGAKSGAILSKMTGEEGSVDTSQAYGSGESGNGYWSVPLGKVMYITSLEVIADVATNKTVDIILYEREDLLDTSTPFAPRRVLWAESGVSEANVEKIFPSHIKIKALTDVFFRAYASAVTKIEVYLSFYLVDANADGA